MPRSGRPVYFRSAAQFRAWLDGHATTESELVLGLYKRDSELKGISYPEALDVALCFGWIDGIRRSVDHQSYSIRFTPRKTGSTWSRIDSANERTIALLTRADRPSS